MRRDGEFTEMKDFNLLSRVFVPADVLQHINIKKNVVVMNRL